MDSISEEYGADQVAAGSARSAPVVSVRGLVKRYGGREAVAGSLSLAGVPSARHRLPGHRPPMT